MLANRFAQQLRRSRIALYSFLPFAALAAANTMDYVQPVLRLVYIVAGFSPLMETIWSPMWILSLSHAGMP